MIYTILFLSIIIIIAIAMTFVAHRKSEVPGAISLMILAVSLIVWSLTYLLYETLAIPTLNKLWIAILFFSMMSAASAQLTFSLSYTNHPNWLNRSALVLLTLMPLATEILLWIEPARAIFFQTQEAIDVSNAFGNLWGRIITFYMYNLAGASVLLLVDMYIRKPRSLFFRAWTILIGSMAPLIAPMLAIIASDQLDQNMVSLFAFTLTGIGFSYGLFNQHLIEAIPVARDTVIEGMDDGWIVLNNQNAIIDINPAAENIVGLSREKAYGRLITSILSDLPGLGQTNGSDQELEMKRSLKSQQGWRYLNIRVSPIKSLNDRNAGRLILWRDITKRKLVEEARQRTRDELFVLLNAISSSASNAINLDDFLLESIYQIVYPFRSQYVGIFLMDERNKSSDPKLFLASQFGIPTEAVTKMTYLPMSNPLAEWVSINCQALLVEDVKSDPRVPQGMQEADLSSLLIIPLLAQAEGDNKFLGMISLGRKEGPVFGQDEVVRLTMISDHIATLIDSDRRRKLAIALSERQRLLRDLHDSVSQKLYGLVTLTEAAQAALEAGSSVNPSQLLVKIGENARQAVKEMRLFLYQIQPVEVEKDGLISSLHHRLAAVEGRADIKARLLADENISLSKQKEVALYFIAQEALNNVLRHAHAKSITLTLKQGRRNVILEILDDGCGFDPKKLDRGGLGLKNIKERTLQVNGKFKVFSKLNEGTKIKVSVPRDQISRSSKRRR